MSDDVRNPVVVVRDVEFGLLRHSEPNGSLYVKAVGSVYLTTFRAREIRSAQEFVERVAGRIKVPLSADEIATAVDWYRSLGRPETDEATLRAENARLREALKRYGQHEACCAFDPPLGVFDLCTCGLTAALQETRHE